MLLKNEKYYGIDEHDKYQTEIIANSVKNVSNLEFFNKSVLSNSLNYVDNLTNKFSLWMDDVESKFKNSINAKNREIHFDDFNFSEEFQARSSIGKIFCNFEKLNIKEEDIEKEMEEYIKKEKRYANKRRRNFSLEEEVVFAGRKAKPGKTKNPSKMERRSSVISEEHFYSPEELIPDPTRDENNNYKENDNDNMPSYLLNRNHIIEEMPSKEEENLKLSLSIIQNQTRAEATSNTKENLEMEVDKNSSILDMNFNLANLIEEKNMDVIQEHSKTPKEDITANIENLNIQTDVKNKQNPFSEFTFFKDKSNINIPSSVASKNFINQSQNLNPNKTNPNSKNILKDKKNVFDLLFNQNESLSNVEESPAVEKWDPSKLDKIQKENFNFNFNPFKKPSHVQTNNNTIKNLNINLITKSYLEENFPKPESKNKKFNPMNKELFSLSQNFDREKIISTKNNIQDTLNKKKGYEITDESRSCSEDSDYENNKKKMNIPSWARDRTFIKKQITYQKNNINYKDIFGICKIENLNLNLIFTQTKSDYNVRGDSADWKLDNTITSMREENKTNQKNYNGANRQLLEIFNSQQN